MLLVRDSDVGLSDSLKEFKSLEKKNSIDNTKIR